MARKGSSRIEEKVGKAAPHGARYRGIGVIAPHKPNNGAKSRHTKPAHSFAYRGKPMTRIS